MDTTDRRLLALLRQDARASFAVLGREVGYSTSAVKRRVDRLVAAGVISGFTTVEPRQGGEGIEALVEIWCRGTIPPATLVDILRAVPAVEFAGTVAGGSDAVVLLRSADIQGLERALETLRDDPRVERTRSSVVLNRLIEGHGFSRPTAMT